MQDENEKIALLEQAKALVASIEADDVQSTDEILNNISSMRDNGLFQEVGRLTRELHDNISGFAQDAQLQKLTDTEIPDAKQRLNYVIEMTDDAANKTMDAVEVILPITDDLEQKSHKLQENWNKFIGRELSVDEFKVMSKEISLYLNLSCENTKLVHEKANEILMAQGYQDLTGQIIKKVITLVHDVEVNLVELVRLAGTQEPTTKDSKEGELEGPLVPGVKVEGAVKSQDDVDDLLSSLGF